MINKPLKRFGQNYLIDNNIINKIIGQINPEPDDNILEIGPGRGALTKHLAGKVKNFTAIEIDTRVIADLKNNYPSLNIINDDFLTLDLSKFCGDQNLKIAGNIPYNITSSIIFKMIASRNYIKEAILMVQHEVAKRMSSCIGSKDYGILSVLLRIFGNVEYCFKVSPNVFRPKPNVSSAVVKIQFNNDELGVEDEQIIKIVKASFGNRRKILKNSLSNSIFKDCDFSNSGINLNRRAEELNADEFVLMAKKLNSIKSYD